MSFLEAACKKNLVLSSLFILLGCGAIRLSAYLRYRAFEQLSERSAPLIEAIERYSTKYGEPPAKLDQLVPEFLEKVPGTGMRLCPEYYYERLDGQKEAHYGNPWRIRLDVGQGFLNFDTFIYLPNQNYHNAGYVEWVQRIGDWGYVHE